MGTWGPAIFSDDTACDVRDSYKEEVANGVEGSEATRIVLASFADSINEPDESPVIWLALAATQSKLGRLEDEVKTRALEIIDTGAGLDVWEEAGPKLLEKRKAALQKLRDQLVSPQSPPKKVRKPFCPPIYLDLQPGDVISYQMQSGEYVLFRCSENTIDRLEGAFPSFYILDWIGTSIPSPSEISRMPYAREITGRMSTNVFSIFFFNKGDFPADRVQVVARGLRFKEHDPDPKSSYWAMMWKTIEEDIQEHFKLTPAKPGGLLRWFRR